MIRVLVVDDSAFMRKALSLMLERAGDIRVVGTARDGEEALEQVKALDPDVLTMDVEMPRMDGLTALRHLMRDAPRPVLMISSLTQDGAATTVEALAAGAFDFIPKDHARISTAITRIEADLHQKVREAARTRRRQPSAASAPALPRSSAPLRFADVRVLVIGISTGGPLALQQLIPALPASFPVPVAIVQHMPPHFTQSLSRRLNASSALEVCEAEPDLPLAPGRVVIARGGEHLTLRHSGRTVTAVLSAEPEALLHRPSVDLLFTSAAEVYGHHALALIMTGMGKDGLEGARRIRSAGGHVLAQDEASCVVYGMPRAVVEAGLADGVVGLDELGRTLATAVGSLQARVRPGAAA